MTDTPPGKDVPLPLKVYQITFASVSERQEVMSVLQTSFADQASRACMLLISVG